MKKKIVTHSLNKTGWSRVLVIKILLLNESFPVELTG